jgi:hypothetical protein
MGIFSHTPTLTREHCTRTVKGVDNQVYPWIIKGSEKKMILLLVIDQTETVIV